MDQKPFQLKQDQRSELEAQQHTQPSPPGKVFETVEELLRHDANQTHPPDQLRERLAESIQDAPPPARSWWRRLLGMG
jgi:hypothetical protein